MIHTLYQALPNARLDIIGGNGGGAEHLLYNSRLIGKTHLLPINAPRSQKIAFYRHLQAEAYDAALLPFDACPPSLFWGTFLAKIPRRVCHYLSPAHHWQRVLKQNLQRMFLPKTHFVPLPPQRHEIDLNYDLLQTLIGKTLERSYNTHIEPPTTTQALDRYGLHSKQYICIQTGAANGLYSVKVWHPERFVEIINFLLEKQDLPIVLLGDKGDLNTTLQPILRAFEQEPRVVNTAGQTTLDELMVLLANTNLLLCHDSGSMHLADAMQIPLLVLFGPSDLDRARPLKATSHVLVSQTPYTKILAHFAMNESALHAQNIGHAAMDGITVDMVKSKLIELLNMAPFQGA